MLRRAEHCVAVNNIPSCREAGIAFHSTHLCKEFPMESFQLVCFWLKPSPDRSRLLWNSYKVVRAERAQQQTRHFPPFSSPFYQFWLGPPQCCALKRSDLLLLWSLTCTHRCVRGMVKTNQNKNEIVLKKRRKSLLGVRIFDDLANSWWGRKTSLCCVLLMSDALVADPLKSAFFLGPVDRRPQ